MYKTFSSGNTWDAGPENTKQRIEKNTRSRVPFEPLFTGGTSRQYLAIW